MAQGPDTPERARSIPSGNDSKGCCRAGWRAIALVANGDRAQSRNGLAGLGQDDVAIGDAAASRDEARRGGGELLESGVGRGKAGPGYATRIHHASLELGELDQRGFDTFFDGTDLSGEFVGGGFDHLSAHDCSFSGAPRAEVIVGPI